MYSYKKNLNKEVMTQILDSFVELTGIKASYFDEYRYFLNGKNQGNCNFCSSLEKYPELKNCCIQSDEEGLTRSLGNNDIYLYKCHMGFWEAVVPVLVDNQVVGFLMLGQIKAIGEEDKNWGEIEKRFFSLNISCVEISKIKKMYSEIKALEREKIEAAAKMLVIMAQYIAKSEAIKVYEMEAIEKAKNYIDKSALSHLTVKSIAAAADLSTSYMSFLFKQQTGKTITNYIENKRLMEAKKLLVKTSLSIKEIAFKAGFEDQNYFSRFFKKHEKVSPKGYRENYRKTLRQLS